MAGREGVCRYPRPGDRVAPATLRQVLIEQAPPRLVEGTPAAGLKLCELDESIWAKLPPETIAELAEIVIARVAAGCVRQAFHDRRFPRLPEGITLADLRLEHRTHLCLARDGYEEDLHALAERTIGEILSIRAFGPRCLVDLLSSVETVLARGSHLEDRLTSAAKRLLALPRAAEARRDDPRFGPLMFEVDPEVDNARDLAERLIARSQDPPDAARAAGQVAKLSERIALMADGTIEDELIQIFASTRHQRNRQIVIGYYGWKDGRSHTLAEIGAQYGMTRERTRQICAKLVKRKNARAIPAPVLDRALELLHERIPASAATLEAALVEAGLTRVGLGLENVRRAAKLLGRPIPFELVRVDSGELAVASKEAELPAAVMELAKKEIYYHGVATVESIRKAFAEKSAAAGGNSSSRPWPAAAVIETLRLMDGFCWLDERGGWFRLAGTCKHGLPRAIDKILAVAPSVTVGELRQAIGRNRRMWRKAPPEKVILEFCRQTPGIRVDGGRIFAEKARSWKSMLTGVEKKLVEVLHEHGPLMERGALEELCVSGGMNRFSFHAFVACSPIITQHGHSIYGLLGADVSTQDVQSLVSKRRAERVPTRVLNGHGRTDDGRVWLSYRLSKAASTYAVITVPAALKEVVRGRFRLVTCDGREVGTLAAKDGRAWGLGAFLRQHNARMHDRVLITLDLDNRTAVIELGVATGRESPGSRPR